MSERPPVEQYVKYVTTVQSLDEAFAFVMSSMEQVGEMLEVHINASYSSGDDFTGKRFGVLVAGMTELPAYEPEAIP